MIEIHQITEQNVQTFKTVRLRALQDAPHAFSATYAQESQLTDAEWLQRTQRWSGERGIGLWRWTMAQRAVSPDHFSTRTTRSERT